MVLDHSESMRKVDAGFRKSVLDLTNIDLGPESTLRVRDYFPETLLWRPELVTDERFEHPALAPGA